MSNSTPARFLLSFFAGLVATFVPAMGVLAQNPIDLTIVGGHVFDTEMGVFRPNRGLGIKNERFVDVRESQQILELGGDDYILPGFIDCHAHYNVRLIKKRREEFEFMPLLYLASGATVTFSAGEFDPHGMLELRERIQTGAQIGPRLITSGPYFGRARPGWDSDRPEEELRKEIDYWAAKGAGGFKAKAIDLVP